MAAAFPFTLDPPACATASWWPVPVALPWNDLSWQGGFWAAATLLLLLTTAFSMLHHRRRAALDSVRVRNVDLERDLAERKRREELIFNLANGVSASTGETFFHELARFLARATGANLAVISARRSREDVNLVRTLAAIHEGLQLDNFDYDARGTPCEPVLAGHLNVCAKDAHATYAVADRVKRTFQARCWPSRARGISRSAPST